MAIHRNPTVIPDAAAVTSPEYGARVVYGPASAAGRAAVIMRTRGGPARALV